MRIVLIGTSDPRIAAISSENPTRSIANGSNFKGTELGIASEQMKVSKVPRTSPITPKRNACEIVFLTRNDEGMPCALKTAKLASF